MEPEDSDAGAVLLALSQVFDRALVVDVCAGELSCEAELDRADRRRLLSGCSAVGSQ